MAQVGASPVVAAAMASPSPPRDATRTRTRTRSRSQPRARTPSASPRTDGAPSSEQRTTSSRAPSDNAHGSGSGGLAQYDITRRIGSGKFSVVYKARRKKDNSPCALKKVQVFDIKDAKARDKCLKEVKLLEALNHEARSPSPPHLPRIHPELFPAAPRDFGALAVRGPPPRVARGGGGGGGGTGARTHSGASPRCAPSPPAAYHPLLPLVL